MDSQSDYDWVEISDTELDANEKFADCELVQQAPTTVILDPPKPTEIPNSNELVLQTFAQDPDTSIRQKTLHLLRKHLLNWIILILMI